MPSSRRSRPDRPTRPAQSAVDDPQRPTATMLLRAYAAGAFPMSDRRNGLIGWYLADPRGVLPLDGLRVPRSLARTVRSGRFEIRFDTSIGAVLRECAGDRGDDSPAWMNDALLAAYLELAQRGHVHTVEAWRDGRLVGGLYGVRLGAAFFGESMFCRPELGGTDASKVCLVHVVDRLRAGGFRLLDTQMVTDHMRQFGCIEISRRAYERRLAEALSHDATWQATGH